MLSSIFISITVNLRDRLWRQSYTTSEKLMIIQFAEEHGNRAAQREFVIAESNVRLWHKSKGNLQKMPRLQSVNRGRKATWPRLESLLCNKDCNEQSRAFLL